MKLISKNRLYSKNEPTREADLIIIYCEGKERENLYFNYFSEINSNIRIEVEAPEHDDDTSPIGLYCKAEKHIIKNDVNINTKYELTNKDTVWFVIDTDSWKEKIDELRKNCATQTNWFVVQSNPCFEVWLFYHFYQYEEFEGMEVSKNWKPFVNRKISGGFDSRKHPILIKDAISNSKEKYNSILELGNTEVFMLAEKILDFVKKELEEALDSVKDK
ncbi:RloB family protein [Aliarcobacter butzleri]|uniref:RloB family protein n=1 Tax=Aliarcobacter butzleri TaxID=28197 RepID=UPI001EDD1161|nr:RloB family protein [Aliarcobacter butzleri]MCG3670621.1 RloB family protein [Aliarcobacter butzleri]